MTSRYIGKKCIMYSREDLCIRDERDIQGGKECFREGDRKF